MSKRGEIGDVVVCSHCGYVEPRISVEFIAQFYHDFQRDAESISIISLRLQRPVVPCRLGTVIRLHPIHKTEDAKWRHSIDKNRIEDFAGIQKVFLIRLYEANISNIISSMLRVCSLNLD